MVSNPERAVKFFKDGYNCSQAVLAVYCDELGVDFDTALKLSSSFGGGMGRLREVCGAVVKCAVEILEEKMREEAY